MTRALTRIRRHVSLRQRLTCRILRRWKKHILAVEETCCVMFSLQSRRTPRSRTTSDGGILHWGARLRCFVVLSTTLLRRSNQISSVLWHLVSSAWMHTRIGLDVMDACCHFHFSVFVCVFVCLILVLRGIFYTG